MQWGKAGDIIIAASPTEVKIVNIGEKIAKARKDKGWTQAELGDKIHVTFQAVSKWERGESSPDFETICELSEVLNVPITYFGGKPVETEKKEVAAAQTTRVVSEYKPVLAVCEKCNKPIYDGDKIVRYHVGHTQHIKCSDCNKKEIDEKRAAAVENGKKRRIHSFIWTSLVSIAGIILSACLLSGTAMIAGIVCSIVAFPLLACLILYNNCVATVVAEIVVWSAVKFPGIIFSFSIDGFIFLITMKILFFLIGALLTVACTVLSAIVGGFVSIFVYPFAIRKNFTNPEIGEYSDFD